MAVFAALSVSVDGFIAGPGDGPEQPLGVGGGQLFEWFGAGDLASQFFPDFSMAADDLAAFDADAARVGAVICGRRTYDISGAWGGHGPQPGVALFVLTHELPAEVPDSDPEYTYVLGGIGHAVRQAQAAAGAKDVSLMGSAPVRECLQAGLLDELVLHVAPVLLGSGVRLLDAVDARLEQLSVTAGPAMAHLHYRVVR